MVLPALYAYAYSESGRHRCSVVVEEAASLFIVGVGLGIRKSFFPFPFFCSLSPVSCIRLPFSVYRDPMPFPLDSTFLPFLPKI
jgi:hypothetical protein